MRSGLHRFTVPRLAGPRSTGMVVTSRVLTRPCIPLRQESTQLVLLQASVAHAEEQPDGFPKANSARGMILHASSG